MHVEAIIFWLLLLDSVTSNIVMWFESAWYLRHFRLLSRLFPPAKGWPLLYLATVLWVGSLLWRMGMLGW